MLKRLRDILLQKVDNIMEDKLSSQMSKNFEGHTLHKLQSNTKSLYDNLYSEVKDQDAETSE